MQLAARPVVQAPAAPAATSMRPMTVDELRASQAAMNMLSKNCVTVPFSLTMTRSLSGLHATSESPTGKFSLALPDGVSADRVVVKRVTVHHSESSSRLPIGVLFGDLKPRYVQSNSDGTFGASLHHALPRLDQPAQRGADEVYAFSGVLDPNWLLAYGHVNTKEQVMSEVNRHPAIGCDDVFLTNPPTAMGAVMLKNAHLIPLRIEIAKNGRHYVRVNSEAVDMFADEIDRMVLSDKDFSRIRLNPKAFDMTLVPRTEAGAWNAVPELHGETPEDTRRELDRKFSVTVQGEIELITLSKV
jgi:hypothetical protein